MLRKNFNSFLNSKNFCDFADRRSKKELIVSLRENRKNGQIKACAEPGQAVEPNISVKNNFFPRRERLFILTFSVIDELEKLLLVDFIRKPKRADEVERVRSIFGLVRCFDEENYENWNVRQRAVVESEKVNFEVIRGFLHGLPASASLEDSTAEYSAYDKAESPAELDKSVENLFEG